MNLLKTTATASLNNLGEELSLTIALLKRLQELPQITDEYARQEEALASNPGDSASSVKLVVDICHISHVQCQLVCDAADLRDVQTSIVDQLTHDGALQDAAQAALEHSHFWSGIVRNQDFYRLSPIIAAKFQAHLEYSRTVFLGISA